MMVSVSRERESAIGTDIVTIDQGKGVVFRNYVVDRPTPSKALRAVEAVLDVDINVPHPVKKVWPVFKDFNSWMNRFGFLWDDLPADMENRYVYAANSGTNDLKYGLDGHKTAYVIRKVIPGQLIYFDSLPMAIPERDGTWSGHNVMSLEEVEGDTRISIFMEHTWYSDRMSIEDLRKEARGAMFDSAVPFWRDYFVPDLLSLIERGQVAAG